MPPSALTVLLGAVLLFCSSKSHALQFSTLLPSAKRKLKTAASTIHRPIKNKLWPKTLSDRNFDEPLPPGPLGCPFVGLNPRKSSPSYGPGLLFHSVSTKLGHPCIFKFFTKGRGIAVVSGYDNARAVLSKEFGDVVPQIVPFSSKVIGESSLRCCREKEQHAGLRKLVGASLDHKGVGAMIPELQTTAESTLKSMLIEENSGMDGNEIEMEAVCQAYALDVACRLIIGLDLPNGEMSVFRDQVRRWFGGIFSSGEGWKEARAYLVGKIERKLKMLEESGPCESTVSGMFFASDEGGRRLSKEEIIDNTLMLILAGSETSAGTLTNCMLLLGLHPEAWGKVAEEQIALRNKHGDRLTRAAVDEAKYLDAVVRETLRMKPIVGGSMRGTASTIVIDGRQIPKGWGVTYDRTLTHLLDPVTREEDGSHMDVRQGFRPERWLDDATRPGQEFIPFGVGPRHCLGAELAMVEMKVFLAVMATMIPSFGLIYPDPSGEIAWREKAVVPVPAKGVSIRPQINNLV